ncbi:MULTISPECIES: excisionase [unclassified Staphylococcus]|uniref:excisionase n=1 Tax=unclassified Staphylococcus TaxID=91994 RepID=UPI001AEC646E|nr:MULTISPECIES: excisionase [unclassified Staphylococcus]
MSINFDEKEIAYIKESVQNYSNEFVIYDEEQSKKKEAFESIVNKIESKYCSDYLFRIIN